MKRLTPQEFLQNYHVLLNVSSEQYNLIAKLMQAYAEHLEDTAWVVDGSLPTLAAPGYSICVIVDDGQSAYYDYDEKTWYKTHAEYRMLEAPLAWRPLLKWEQPPKP